MKLLRAHQNGWEYELNPNEANCLRMLLQYLPLTPAFPGQISRAGNGDKETERTQLLNESLAVHRETLKQKTLKFLATDRLKPEDTGCRLRLGPEEKEFLLQLLNHIRVSSWRALGAPENLEGVAAESRDRSPDYFMLMELAGFFEGQLLQIELGQQPG